MKGIGREIFKALSQQMPEEIKSLDSQPRYAIRSLTSIRQEC
jgi:hypothetical protein